MPLPYHIFSVRGNHLDALPGTVMQEIIRKLKENFPNLPITLVYEADPATESKVNEKNIEKQIRLWKGKIDSCVCRI